MGDCSLPIWCKYLARGMCLALICVMVLATFFESGVVSLMYELLGAVVGSVAFIVL